MKPSYLNINNIKSPDQCLRWWLVHSYLYYIEGTSLLDDNDWNTLGSWLKSSFNATTHAHRALVDIECVESTAFYIREYPNQIKYCARMLIRWHGECVRRKKLALRRGHTTG
mgnify:CR=1 FL=1